MAHLSTFGDDDNEAIREIDFTTTVSYALLYNKDLDHDMDKRITFLLLFLIAFNCLCGAGPLALFAAENRDDLVDKFISDFSNSWAFVRSTRVVVLPFKVAKQESSVLGFLIADELAAGLQSKAPFKQVEYYFPWTTETTGTHGFVPESKVLTDFDASGEEYLVISGVITPLSTTIRVECEATTDTSSRVIYTTTRDMIRTPIVDFDLERELDSEPDVIDSRPIKGVSYNRVPRISRSLSGHSVEALAGLVFESYGNSVEIPVGAVSAGYLYRLKTEKPISIGAWIGIGTDMNSIAPVGGLKLVWGEKRESVAYAANLGVMPTVGIYYKNFILNAAYWPYMGVGVELGYSFDLK
ncbi:MAG: hypothetical protein HN368_02225 [Spirochaetales bacterium]|jgi:hypothetical protein|nr:hypothetical protein [Spirochaetales bacterium]